MNDELEEVLEAIDIESWLDSEGVKYRESRGSSGRQLNLKDCPFCANSKWKCFVNADTGLGNCFAGSCEKKFNKWSLIRAHIGEDTPVSTVVARLKQTARDQGWRAARKTPVAVNLATLKLPESYELPIKGANLQYLDRRGIDIGTARYFNLRYSHTGKFWYDFEGQRRFQDYSRRVIIPIFDLNGALVSFQGRDITGTAEKKYLFPPGYASTGAHLFNAQNVQNTARVAIAEGVFDVFALKLALDADTSLRDVTPIGTFGKHLADEQEEKLVRLKERGVKEITFFWDSEFKALEAACHAATMLKGRGFLARVAVLPKDCDPNEVSAEVVQQAYYRATVITPLSAAKLLLEHRASQGISHK